MNESSTPETDALWYKNPEQHEVYKFACKLERQRDEAREILYQITGKLRKKDKTLPKPAEVLDWMADKTRKIEVISKRAEAIRCELAEKDKQLEVMRFSLMGAQQGAEEARKIIRKRDEELEAMREAIKEAYRVIENARFVHQAITTYAPQDAVDKIENQKHCNNMSSAIAKLQPFIQ